jgi:hypothetical protein
MKTASQRIAAGLVVGFVAAFVAACGDQGPPPEEARTVTWYLDHKAERVEKHRWCQDDSVRWQMPSCVNAAAAEQQAIMGDKHTVADGLTFK